MNQDKVLSCKEAMLMAIQAAYEGTIRTAALKGKRRVFLTMVGAGVFASGHTNQIVQWIFEALNDLMPFIQASGLDVILISYASLPYSVENNFKALIKKTNGYYKD